MAIFDDHDARGEPLQWAWAAGLFEGEGSIMFNRTRAKGRYYSAPRLQLRMTDRDVVDQFHRVVGCGGIVVIANPAHIAAGRKPAWDWRCQARDDVELVLRRFHPFFGGRRRAKADEAFAAIEEARATPYGARGSTYPLPPVNAADGYRD